MIWIISAVMFSAKPLGILASISFLASLFTIEFVLEIEHSMFHGRMLLWLSNDGTIISQVQSIFREGVCTTVSARRCLRDGV
jgi:hypothetical protein